MSEAEWLCWVDEAERQEARAVMAMAQAALYPHAGRHGTRMWDAWAERAYPREPTRPAKGQRGSDIVRGWFAQAGVRLGN